MGSLVVAVLLLIDEIGYLMVDVLKKSGTKGVLMVIGS